MALDTTIGGTDPTKVYAYCDLAYANQYHQLFRGFNSEWATASDQLREVCIAWATMLIDAHFTEYFIGKRASWQQILAWPRFDNRDAETSVLDNDGFILRTDVYPRQLQQATAEFAFYLLQEDWSRGLSSVTDEGMDLGELKLTKETHNPIPASVKLLLKPLLSGYGSNEMVRG